MDFPFGKGVKWDQEATPTEPSCLPLDPASPACLQGRSKQRSYNVPYRQIPSP